MNIDKTAVVSEGAHVRGDVKIGKDVFLAPGVCVVGDVTIGEESSVWYNSVLRSDQSCIRIGARVNVQDGCIFHVDEGIPVILGDEVSVGHGAILHSCTVGDRSLIGMGAVLLNNAQVGADCLIGAGSLVTQGMVIPDGHLAFGSPARIRRPLTKEEIRLNRLNALEYLDLAEMERKDRLAEIDS